MTRNATLVVLAMLSIIAISGPATAGTVKASGVPDSTTLLLTFTNDTSALATLDQNWEGVRGNEMRQSLDAYFGNGDGKLSESEIARIAAAASKDMLAKAWDPLSVDGAAARVASVIVTMDGALGNQTGTRLVIHHAITLTIPSIAGGNHSFALASLWNGTYTIEPPAGLALNGDSKSAPVTGTLMSGNSVPFTLAPPAVVPPPTPVSSTPIVTPNESVATTTPSGPLLPAKRGIPGPATLSVALALCVAAALLLARRRR